MDISKTPHLDPHTFISNSNSLHTDFGMCHTQMHAGIAQEILPKIGTEEVATCQTNACICLHLKQQQRCNCNTLQHSATHDATHTPTTPTHAERAPQKTYGNRDLRNLQRARRMHAFLESLLDSTCFVCTCAYSKRDTYNWKTAYAD